MRRNFASYAVVLAASAGLAIALQVVVNSVGIKDLGVGCLIALSGAATAVAGLLWAVFAARPEVIARAALCALASGVLGPLSSGRSCSPPGRAASRGPSRSS